MKTILISSAISLAIGFTFGWLIKSSSTDLDSIVQQVPTQGGPVKRPRATDGSTTPATQRNKPRNERPPASPNTGLPEGTADTTPTEGRVDMAKWMRLIEVLGLDDDQAKALEAAIAEALSSTDNGDPIDEAYAAAGSRLEKAILAILTPEQRKAFAKLQQRSLENQIEVKAQKAYAQELGNLDLSADQREQALGLLRDQARAQETSIPASTRLLLTNSFLPVGQNGFSPEAIQLLKEITTPVDPGSEAFEQLVIARKAEIEKKMNIYEGILTPAQIARFRVQLSESSEILDQIRRFNQNQN